MRTILACIDLSEHSTAVLECARSLAQPGGQVVLLHVAAPDPEFVGYAVGPQSVRDAVAGELRSEHRQLQQLAAVLASTGLAVTPLTVQGVVVECIVEHARRLGADFIVVASRGRSALSELAFGSTVRGLLRAAPVPLVVVPAVSTQADDSNKPAVRAPADAG